MKQLAQTGGEMPEFIKFFLESQDEFISREDKELLLLTEALGETLIFRNSILIFFFWVVLFLIFL